MLGLNCSEMTNCFQVSADLGRRAGSLPLFQTGGAATSRPMAVRGRYAPLLSELHWLPIEAHIRHKIAVLTF